MKNVLFTYTITLKDGTAIKNTVWTTWREANHTAYKFLVEGILDGVNDVTAIWYGEKHNPILKREFILGKDFFTYEPTVVIKDTDF